MLCVLCYVLWGMYLGRTLGLRGAEGEHCHDLQDAAHFPLSQYSKCTSSNSGQIY